MSIQQAFIERATKTAKRDKEIIGLAVGGSWITGEIDDFSDVDLILFTKDKLSDDKTRMVEKAANFGSLLNAFTGEHVGEPRVLICLYDEPLLHVDVKFLVPEEFITRIENPIILFDRDGVIQKIIDSSQAVFPYPDYQWIEDRFWTWIHYAALKIGRGEYLEAFDFFSFLRMVVFGPMLAIKNGHLPRGVRKVEFILPGDDLIKLVKTIPGDQHKSMLSTLHATIDLYKELRSSLPPPKIEYKTPVEQRVLEYVNRLG